MARSWGRVGKSFKKEDGDLCDGGPAGRTGHRTGIPHSAEPVVQGMDQDAEDDLRRCQPHHLMAVAERDAGTALQRNATQSASALTSRAFRVATRWVYRLRQASADLGQSHPVRQAAIADITFSCKGLTCPASAGLV